MKLTRVCMSANHASFITTITGEEKVETWSRAGHHLHQILNYIYSFFAFIFFSITAFCIQLLSVLMAQSSGKFLTDDLKNKTKKSLHGDIYIYIYLFTRVSFRSGDWGSGSTSGGECNSNEVKSAFVVLNACHLSQV